MPLRRTLCHCEGPCATAKDPPSCRPRSRPDTTSECADSPVAIPHPYPPLALALADIHLTIMSPRRALQIRRSPCSLVLPSPRTLPAPPLSPALTPPTPRVPPATTLLASPPLLMSLPTSSTPPLLCGLICRHQSALGLSHAVGPAEGALCVGGRPRHSPTGRRCTGHPTLHEGVRPPRELELVSFAVPASCPTTMPCAACPVAAHCGVLAGAAGAAHKGESRVRHFAGVFAAVVVTARTPKIKENGLSERRVPSA